MYVITRECLYTQDWLWARLTCTKTKSKLQDKFLSLGSANLTTHSFLSEGPSDLIGSVFRMFYKASCYCRSMYRYEGILWWYNNISKRPGHLSTAGGRVKGRNIARLIREMYFWPERERIRCWLSSLGSLGPVAIDWRGVCAYFINITYQSLFLSIEHWLFNLFSGGNIGIFYLTI